VAARVAAALGFAYLDSGRPLPVDRAGRQTAGYRLGRRGWRGAIAAALDVEFSEAIFVSTAPVGDAIRTEEISAGASKVAALPAVREALLFRQRAFNTGAWFGRRRARHGLGGLSAGSAQGLPDGECRSAR
jgi:3-phosphoshikimate 1-carboxyvinyltransferase